MYTANAVYTAFCSVHCLYTAVDMILFKSEQCQCSVHCSVQCIRSKITKSEQCRGSVHCRLQCIVDCMVSVHSSYTVSLAVYLQCTLPYTAGTLHFGLGYFTTGAFRVITAETVLLVDCLVCRDQNRQILV